MQNDNENPRKMRPSAKRKVMDLLARRDHSTKELEKKLKTYDYNSEEIQQALIFAEENHWMKNPSELSEGLSQVLHRKLKGVNFINNSLREKGLPEVKNNPEFELEKAMKLVRSKLGDIDGQLPSNIDRNEKARVGRFLAARGFDSETIRKVLYEEL